jgi:hypothetical protein
MKIIDLAAIDARSATPTAVGLGFDMAKELNKTAAKAVKPLEARLRAYVANKATVQSKIDRWCPEAFDAKMAEITTAALTGDEQAAEQIEGGNVPTRQTFDRMAGMAYAEMDAHERASRPLFAEAAAVVAEPMRQVVARGQAVLDSTLQGLGVPPFELRGATNAVDYMVDNLHRASRGESADLQPFWQALGWS